MPRGTPGSCKVCDSKEAATIRRKAITGSIVKTAKEYKMSPVTLDKCIKNHKVQELRDSIGLTIPTQNITTQMIADENLKANSTITKIVNKEGWTEEVQRYATDIDDTLLQLKQSKQSHLYTNLGHVKVKLLELQGKSLNVFSPDTAIQINNFTNSDDYKKLKQIVIQTLMDKWPDALLAVGEALRESGL